MPLYVGSPLIDEVFFIRQWQYLLFALTMRARANKRETGFSDLNELDTTDIIKNRAESLINLSTLTVLNRPLIESFIALYPEMIELAYNESCNDFFPITHAVSQNHGACL